MRCLDESIELWTRWAAIDRDRAYTKHSVYLPKTWRIPFVLVRYVFEVVNYLLDSNSVTFIYFCFDELDPKVGICI